MTEKETNLPSAVFAGAVLLAASLVSLLFMTHHPSLGAPGYETLIEEVVAKSGLNQLVHGGMIMFVLLFYYALSVLSARLGAFRSEVRAAQLALACATVSMVGAALVSGFMIADVAHYYADNAAANDQAYRSQLVLMGTANQVLAKAGTLGYGAAILFWSVRLLRLPGINRVGGVLGCSVAVILIAGILRRQAHLDIHGMTIVLVALVFWFCLISVQLLRQKI